MPEQRNLLVALVIDDVTNAVSAKITVKSSVDPSKSVETFVPADSIRLLYSIEKCTNLLCDYLNEKYGDKIDGSRYAKLALEAWEEVKATTKKVVLNVDSE